jgi:hypothetical protein
MAPAARFQGGCDFRGNSGNNLFHGVTDPAIRHSDVRPGRRCCWMPRQLHRPFAVSGCHSIQSVLALSPPKVPVIPGLPAELSHLRELLDALLHKRVGLDAFQAFDFLDEYVFQ